MAKKPEKTEAEVAAEIASLLAYLRTIPRPSNAEIDRAGEILRRG